MQESDGSGNVRLNDRLGGEYGYCPEHQNATGDECPECEIRKLRDQVAALMTCLEAANGREGRYKAALEWICSKENHAAGLEINSRLRAQIALDNSITHRDA